MNRRGNTITQEETDKLRLSKKFERELRRQGLKLEVAVLDNGQLGYRSFEIK